MAFIDMSDEPVFIKTEAGVKSVKVTKKEYNKDMGCYIIREYEEVRRENRHDKG